MPEKRDALGYRAKIGILVPATNTIYHDAEHPSALVLPIVPTT